MCVAKSLWRFTFDPSSFWRGIIFSRHDPRPFEWLSKGVKGSHRNLWKIILKELPSFSHFVRYVVGEGKDAYFWEDHWVGKRPLCSLFPRLYHLSAFKNYFVVVFLVWTRSSCSFSFGFSSCSF